MKHKVKVFFLLGWLLVLIHGQQIFERDQREPFRNGRSPSESRSVSQDNSTMLLPQPPKDLHTTIPVPSDIQIVPGVERMPHHEYSVHHTTHLPPSRGIDNTAKVMDFLPPRRLNSRGPVEDEPKTINTTNIDLSESSRAFDQPNHSGHTSNPHDIPVDLSESSGESDQPSHSDHSTNPQDIHEPTRTHDHLSPSGHTPQPTDMHKAILESTRPFDQPFHSSHTPNPHDSSSLQSSDQPSYSGYTPSPHVEHVTIPESSRPSDDHPNHSGHTDKINKTSSLTSEDKSSITNNRTKITDVNEEESDTNEKLSVNPVSSWHMGNNSRTQNVTWGIESYQEQPEEERGPFENGTLDNKEDISTNTEGKLILSKHHNLHFISYRKNI